MRVTFDCSLCGKQAGGIHLSDAEVRRESWPGVMIQPVGAGMRARLEAALAARDIPTVFALEPELTPFWCPACGVSYCSEHWDWWDVWDEELATWRDSVRGSCPQGHERMLED